MGYRHPMPLPVFLVHYDAPDWVAASARSILASDIDLAVTVVATGLGVRHLAAYRRYAGGAGHREQGSSV